MGSILSNILAQFRLSANIINSGLSGTLVKNYDNRPAVGAGLGQVNIGVVRDVLVDTGTPLDLDLTSVIDNGGDTIVFAKLTHYAIINGSIVAGQDFTHGGGTNPVLAADAVPIEANGGMVFRAIPYNGITIDATHKTFRFSVAAGLAVPCSYMLLGRS